MVGTKIVMTAAMVIGATLAPNWAVTPVAAANAPAEIAPAKPLPELPRNQQLILGWSIASPIGVTNPWAVPGYTHQEGNVLMWEPLMYYRRSSPTNTFRGWPPAWSTRARTSPRWRSSSIPKAAVERRRAGHGQGRRSTRSKAR